MSASFPIVVASTGVGLCMFWLLIPVAIYCLYKGYQAASYSLLLEHTPTSNCGGVSPGRVELKAEAVSESPLRSPLTDKKVAYFEYKIEEQRGSSSDNEQWVEVASGEQWKAFDVHDDSGRVRVDPTDAEFHPEVAVEQTVNRGHSLFTRGPAPHPNARRRRVHEKHIALDQEVYIFGAARSRQDLGIPEVHAGSPDEPYIISTTDESYMVDRYGRRATINFWIGGIAAVTLPILGTMVVGDMPLGEALGVALIPTFIIGLGVAGVMWALHRMKHSEYLQDLQNRMGQAETILRRECHHRERLMARIVNAARLAVDNSDRRRLDAIASQRKQEYSQATFKNVQRLCPMVNAQSDALERVFRIIERYDEFQSDDDFYELLEELTRCEKQIMMARDFYNNAVWRLRQQPEAMVGDTRATSGLSFERFEDKPVDVILPEDPDDEYGGDFVRNRDERRERQGADTQRIEIDDDFFDDVANSATEKLIEMDEERADDEGPPAVPGVEGARSVEEPSLEVATAEAVEMEVADSASIEVATEIEELETPEFEPETAAFSSSMSFNDGPTMEGIGDFGDIGRFGATRRFDDFGAGDEAGDDDEAEGREYFGFGPGEKAALSSADWDPAQKLREQKSFGFGRGEKAALSSAEWDPAQKLREQKSFGFGGGEKAFGFADDEKSVLEAFGDDDEDREKR